MRSKVGIAAGRTGPAARRDRPRRDDAGGSTTIATTTTAMTMRQQISGVGTRRRSAGRVRATAQAEADAEPEFGQHENWTPCRERLASLGLSDDDADDALKAAFGWSKQSYWRKTVVKETPTIDMVEERLGVLAGLGMTDAEVGAVVNKFPEVLGCSASLLERNVEHVQRTFFVKNKALVNTIKRKPEVLGNIVDCEGNCVGDCNRCWVRF